jgi:putative transcriptional regulator
MNTGPKSLIIAIGCAGWGPYQLESEIRQNAWLTGPISEDILFDISAEARWEESLRKMGIDPTLLLDTAGHA